MQLESNYVLNPIDELDLFCIHWIYVPVINLHLKQFQSTWNHHKIRTAGNRTPYQMMIESLGLIDFDEPLPEALQVPVSVSKSFNYITYSNFKLKGIIQSIK